MAHSRRRPKKRHGQTRRKPQQNSVGTIRVTRRGYAFVATAEGEYFIFGGHLHGAMDGDLVEVTRLRTLERHRRGLYSQDYRRESGQRSQERERLGSVSRVIERQHQTIIGVLSERDGLRVVRPTDERIRYDIFIDLRAVSEPAADGDIVLVRLTTWPSRLESASGYIEEVIGRSGQAGLDIEIILRSNNIPTAFPAAALEAAAACCQTGFLEARRDGGPAGQKPGHAAEAKTGAPTKAKTGVLAKAKTGVLAEAANQLPRRDLRETFVFTIDPSDARDFDDALSADFVNGQLLLGVHIADVSAYVLPDSPLDTEAYQRATSVYLPDRVVPMLPPALSDDLCSLKPGVDRPAFSVLMLMGPDGSVAEVEFTPSLIRSRVRLSYDEADAWLAERHPGGVSITEAAPADAANDQLVSRLQTLDKLARQLKRRRLARGAIDFDSVEAKVRLDADGQPQAVELRRHTAATSLIEEAMILANEQVATFMQALEPPPLMVYRIHEEPFSRSLAETGPILQEFGYPAVQAPVTSAAVQAILTACQGQPEQNLISTLLLRSMKRARYAPAFTTHFGLASPAYCQFTSPIRRYPDLLVHRYLKQQLAAQAPAAAPAAPPAPAAAPAAPAAATVATVAPVAPPAARHPKPAAPSPAKQAWLEAACQHCSEREQAAEAAARAATALKLAEFMSTRLGQRFEVSVTAVTVYGLTVRELSTTAEGYIQREDLPTPLTYEPERHRYFDADAQTGFRLGQKLTARLEQAELNTARLYFVLG